MGNTIRLHNTLPIIKLNTLDCAFNSLALNILCVFKSVNLPLRFAFISLLFCLPLLLTAQNRSVLPKNDTSLVNPELLQDSINYNNAEENIPNFQQNDEFGGNVGQESIKVSEDSLDAPVKYDSKDSFKIDVPGKVIHLYGDAHVYYKNATSRGLLEGQI